MTTQQSAHAGGGASTRFQDAAVDPGLASGSAVPAWSLLEAILEAGGPGRAASATRLAGFLGEPSPWQALVRWLGSDFPYHEPDLKQRILARLSQDVVRLDELLGQQLN